MTTPMTISSVKRQATRLALLTLIIAMTPLMTRRPHADAGPTTVAVVAVPWQGSRAKPHAVTQNGSVVLQAVASAGADGNPITLIAGTWDPGDGSGPQLIDFSNSRVLELSHTYTGAVGTPYTATISVTDANNVVYTDTFKVLVQPDSLDTRVNMAIDRGLWFNHKTMNLTASGAFTLGFWNDSDTNAATSAAVQAYEVNGHRATGDVTQDPYVDDVARGLRYLEQHLSRVALGSVQYTPSGTPGTPVPYMHSDYNAAAVVISPNLQLTRGAIDTLQAVGSDGTKWRFGSCAAASGPSYNNFNDLFWATYWFSNVTGDVYDAQSVPGTTVCLVDTTTSQAYDLTFTSWAGYYEYYAIYYWGGYDYYNGVNPYGPFSPGGFSVSVAQYSGGATSSFTPDLQGHAGTPADPGPDVNGNGYGLQTDGGSIVYVGGQIIDAFVASGTKNATAVVGSEVGRTYGDIVQDLIDAYSWGQTDPASLMPNNHSPNGQGGGWIYNWNDNGDNIDSSSSGWWGVGVHAAEIWNLTVPPWVKDLNLNAGIPQVQGADGSCGYRNPYQNVWSLYTDTASCMIMLSADGQPRSSTKFTNAENWAAANFGNFYSATPGGYAPDDSVYSMYNLTKAMRLAKDSSGNSTPITLLGGTVDWFAGLPVPGNLSDPHNGLAYNLITNQRSDGKLAPQNAPGVGDSLANSWGTLILSPALFENGPTAKCSTDTNIVCQAGAPLGSGSCNTTGANPYATVHFDGSQSTAGDNPIASYSWNFQDGGSSVDATTVQTSTQFAAAGTYNVQLTVTDVHNISSTATCPVSVTAAALAPIASAGGPYTMCVGTGTVVLDASQSIGRGSNIQSYAWDVKSPIDFAAVDASTASTNQTAYFNSLGPGTYDVGLRIVDDATPANTVTTFTTVTVQDCAPPVITVPANVSVITQNPAGTTVTYAAPTVLDNVDGAADALTCTSSPTVGLSSGSNFPVGTTTITCTAQDHAHNVAAPASFSVTVSNLITSTATANPVSGTFNGSAFVGSGSCSPASLTPVITYTPGPGAPINVGTTNFTVTCGDNQTQYTTSMATGSITIAAAPVIATAGSGSSVYDGGSHAPSACVISGSYTAGLSCVNDPASAGPGVGTTVTSPVVSGTGLDNFAITTVKGSYAITPATPVASATGGTFTYDGTAHAGACSVTGVGTDVLTGVVSYSSPATPTDAGGYTVTCSFDATANYNAASATAPLTINPAPVTATAGGGTAVFDGATHTPAACAISGAYKGDLNCTNSPAVAGPAVSTTVTAPVVTGTTLSNYAITIVDGSYAITLATSTTVVTCTDAVYSGSPITTTCSANVTGDGGLNQPVTPVTYGNNINVGTANASATYAGDANHSSSTGTGSFAITQAGTSTGVVAPTITYAANGVVTVSVSSGSGMVVGNVTLTVDGGAPLTQPLSGGSATFVLSSPNAGSHSLVASFAAQGNFAASSTSGTLLVNKSQTTTTLGAVPAVQAQGQPVTLTATVVALSPGSGVPNGTVTFTDGSTVLGTSPVDASGHATLAPTSLPLGPRSITATYSGSSNYFASTSNIAPVTIYGYPTGGGTFAIGDQNAAVGTSVNFWGAQWEKNNSLSGGPSSASFKGFVVAPAIPAVGGTFTAAPGNSAPSPAAIPEYIGIIVTSKVTKSGSTINGTIAHLVVVKVNPGYAGDPGHAGTGTVVAVIQ